MSKREFSFKEASLAFLLAFLLSQVFVFAGQTIMTAILSIFNYSADKISAFTYTKIGYTILSLFQLASFVCVFIFCYKNTDLKTNFSKSKKLSWKVLIYIFLGILTMFSLSYFINYFTMFLNLIGQSSSSLPFSLNTPLDLFVSIITLAVFPSIGEELLFRATILNGLKKRNKLFALIISSLFFTIFHFNLSQLFYPFLFGLLLGATYLLTDNILVPIIVHFTNNALNIFIQYFSKSSSFSASALNFTFMVLGIIIYIVIISILLTKLFKKEKQEILLDFKEQSLSGQELNKKLEENKLLAEKKGNQSILSSNSNESLNENNNATNLKDEILSKENPYIKKMNTTDKIKFLWPIFLMIILYIINITIGA